MALIHLIDKITYRFLSAWCDLFDGIIGIITLGFWLPGISYAFCVLHMDFVSHIVEKYGEYP